MSFIVDKKELKVYMSEEGITDIVIPDGVVLIEENVFRGHKEITSVVIPDSVEYIKTRAFYNCENLKTIYMSKNIKCIGNEAFGNCYSLKKVHVKDLSAWCGACFLGEYNPLSYGKRLYVNNKKIGKNLIIPEGTKKINMNAFYRCEGIETVVVPSSVTEIDRYAFYESFDIRKFSICSNLKEIGNYVLNGTDVEKLATVQAFAGSVLDYWDLEPMEVAPFYTMFNFSDVTVTQKEKEAYLPDLLKKCQRDINYYISYAAFADNDTILSLTEKLSEWRASDIDDTMIAIRVTGGLLLNPNIEAMKYAKELGLIEYYEYLHRNYEVYINNICRIKMWS